MKSGAMNHPQHINKVVLDPCDFRRRTRGYQLRSRTRLIGGRIPRGYGKMTEPRDPKYAQAEPPEKNWGDNDG